MSNINLPPAIALKQSNPTGDWAAAFFADADLVDIDALAAWFAENIELRFANNPVITDKATAVSVMSQFFSSISKMKHRRENLVGTGDEVAQQAVVTYTTPDGRDLPLPVSSYLRRDSQGLLDRLWIYIDIAPLYAPVPPSHD